ncbi:glycosyltransferase family 39 protein [Actinotalea solisilvae]|uniref:glycosyltransferase family 39 protein n=1 Tax=Actinotalea solisilvae TaxID=2072922 RepID=UPI0018F14115|nr:glycosyltransferase family 39 protein [Actinotalea solisilvae]
MSATARPGARDRGATRPATGSRDAVAAGARGTAEPAPSRRTSVVVGVLAALMAAVGSWSPALWSDEVATISAASRSLPDLLRLTGEVDAVHATYYLLMHAWVQVAGTSAVAVRLPSAVAVGIAAAGVHVLARRLGGPRPATTALVAAAVFTLLPRVTWAGVEARPFAASIAAAVWLTFLLHVAVGRAQPARTRRLALAGYAVLLAVGVAVNLYVALVAAAHGVTLLARRRTRAAVLPFLLAAGAGLALVAPLVVTALGQGGQLGAQDLGLVRLAQNVGVNQWFLGETPTPTTADGSLEDALTPGGVWKPAALLLAAACWTLVAGVVVRALRRGAPTDARADLLAWTLPWLVLPAVVVVAGSVISPSLYNARYFGVCAPALALLLAAALRDLAPRRAVAVGVVLALLAAPVVASQRTATAKSGSDWLAVVGHLDDRTAPGDGVYFGPRDPFDDGVVKRSLRALSLGYPEPFEGLVDVTLLDAPADGATLFGTSVPLATSLDRLEDLDTLWVLRRQDRPAEATAEDALLAEAGFRVVDVWDGPQTQVVELRR